MPNDVQYKSLLIVNESRDAKITLYIYPRWDFVCWISFSSKIILPGEKYLYRSKDSYKFELVAGFEDKPKESLLEPKTWVADKLLKVTEDLRLIEGELEDFPLEKRVCLRRLQRDKELNVTSGKRNLYDILELDMDQIRKLPIEKQRDAIKKGFRKQIQRWHPDKNFGDEENAKEIIMAQEILLNDEMRARYHNEADYDRGWLSFKRYKAILNPERFTTEQKEAYKKRILMFAASVGIAICGIGLTIGTAGAAAPLVVAVGGVFGGAITGAGIQSLQHTVNKRSVVTEECNTKQWLLKAGIGLISGAAIGGAAVGITAGVVGLGSSAMESAVVTAGQYMGTGVGTGAVGGAVSSIASDIGRKFVDGEKVSLKQAACRATFGAAIGATEGIAGGVVSKAIVGGQSSAATANIQGEVGEQIAILTGAKRLTDVLVRNVSRAVTESGAEAVMGTAAQFVEERLDDSVENQSPGQHFLRGAINFASKTIKAGFRESSSALLSHSKNEIDVSKRAKKYSNLEVDIYDKSGARRGQVRQELFEENNEHLVKCEKSTCSATYQPLESEGLLENKTYSLPTVYEEAVVPCEQEDPLRANEHVNPVVDIEEEAGVNDYCGQVNLADQLLESDELSEDKTSPLLKVREEVGVLDKRESNPLEDTRIKYISEGAWFSRMIVSFFLNDEKITQQVSGSGKFITIPSPARGIKVKFQVSRPFWGDVMKYDRFKEAWFRPYEPHVFCYDNPTNRTFIVSGNLWWEAVMRVSDEYHDETKEL
ncbi:uncharacterized protein LOC111334544 [Stylophora pistillata]|nr:uncharacterized protein LOC111334544 [Stylophora pistillata]XP_022796042.1 uncharacterized protein LOC111334544 [Stylophora pistillata]